VSATADAASCPIPDISLPRLRGVDLQAELAKANVHIPITFCDGASRYSMSMRAMKAGAVNFLTKPFRDQEMLDTATAALECDRNAPQRRKSCSDLQARWQRSTPSRY